MSMFKSAGTVFSFVAIGLAAASFVVGPSVWAEDEGMSDRETAERKHMGSDKDGAGMMLSPEQKNTVMAQLNDMKESLADEGDREELEQELAYLMCRMEIAKQLMKDPEVKKALKQNMASPDGEKLMGEMKVMMAGGHEQMHEDMLSDEDEVYDILLMVKAMTLTKAMNMSDKADGHMGEKKMEKAKDKKMMKDKESMDDSEE